jgi:hypothetical protein
LDVVRIEVLQLEPVLEEHRPDELPGGDGEAALVEGYELDDVPREQAQHGLLSWHLPLNGVGERRELSGLEKAVQHRADTLDRVQFDMVAANSRADLRCEL